MPESKDLPPPYTEFAEPPGSTQPTFHQPVNPHQYACKLPTKVDNLEYFKKFFFKMPFHLLPMWPSPMRYLFWDQIHAPHFV